MIQGHSKSHDRSEDRRKPGESQIGKGPDREPEEATLQREAKDARNRYRGRTRTAGVVWNGERAPERGGDQWNGEGNQDPQPVITPMPAPQAHDKQRRHLKQESDEKVNRMCSHVFLAQPALPGGSARTRSS